MLTVLTLVSVLLAAIIVHETAHALALRGLGIPISRAGLGLPFPPTLTIPARGRHTFAVTFSPWLVGAYVQPDSRYDAQIEALPYRQKTWFLNAGIVANLLLGFAAYTIAAALQSRWLLASAFAATTVAVWFGRRIAAAYLIPALAVPALILVAVALGQSWAAGETGAGYADMVNVVPSPGVQTVVFLGTVSLSLAVLNALPLFGLDNGKVVDLLLHRWFGDRVLTVYRLSGAALLAGVLLLAVGSDLWAAVTAIAD